MADIRIGNGKWAFSDDIILGYSTAHNKYKSVILDNKRFCGKFRQNSNKELEAVVNNAPAIDYEFNNAGALNTSIQHTQQVSYTEDLTQSSIYFTNNIVLSQAGVNSPKNDRRNVSDANESPMRVWKVRNINVTSNAYLQLTQTVFSSSPKTVLSFFVRKDTQKNFAVQVRQGGVGLETQFNMDLDTGQVTQLMNKSVFYQSPVINEYVNGWYRVHLFLELPSGQNLFRFMAAQSPTGQALTLVDEGYFITGLNFYRETALHEYVYADGVVTTVTQDALTRINNVQYFLPSYANNSQNGFTWTFKFKATRLQTNRYISLAETGATQSTTNKSLAQFRMTSLGSNNFDLGFDYNLGSDQYVAGSTFMTKTLNVPTLVVGQTYHVGVTVANGFLRLSLNGTDANELNNGSTPTTGSTDDYFRPNLASGRQFNDLRLMKPNTQTQGLPCHLIDTAIYDRSMTQSELNLLTLQ